ncbi:AAA family ATPase, partial [Streptacidiphilus monticola]
MGRAHEEEILDRLLDGAEQKETSLLLRGDPGVGKTTLLDFAAARARRAGSDVVRVIGVESERELPFSGLHQLLFPLVGALEELPAYQRELLEQVLSFREGPTPARLAISAAALSLVLAAAGRAPLVVLIDDLQWIDRSSAEVLTFLLRRLAGRRPSFVLATRDRETGFFDPAGLPVLPVGPLAPDAARALLELRHPGLRAPLQRRLLAEAEGNPLALVELPGQLSQAQRDGLEEVPGSLPLSSRLESVFADRIRQLDPTTRMALLMVALDGERPGNLAEIRAALLLADRAWDETLLDRAATAGLVQVDHACERLTFRHPLARSCLLHMSPRTRRKAAHEVWAAALSAQRDRRAWHLAHAADG